jgi:hypothetical protein
MFPAASNTEKIVQFTHMSTRTMKQLHKCRITRRSTRTPMQKHAHTQSLPHVHVQRHMQTAVIIMTLPMLYLYNLDSCQCSCCLDDICCLADMYVHGTMIKFPKRRSSATFCIYPRESNPHASITLDRILLRGTLPPCSVVHRLFQMTRRHAGVRGHKT